MSRGAAGRPPSREWVLDRRESGLAVVLAGGAVFEMPAELVPADARDGDCLRVTPLDGAAGRVVVEVAVDPAATARRRAEAAARVERLRAADDGADIRL